MDIHIGKSSLAGVGNVWFHHLCVKGRCVIVDHAAVEVAGDADGFKAFYTFCTNTNVSFQPEDFLLLCNISTYLSRRETGIAFPHESALNAFDACDSRCRTLYGT